MTTCNTNHGLWILGKEEEEQEEEGLDWGRLIYSDQYPSMSFEMY